MKESIGTSTTDTNKLKKETVVTVTLDGVTLSLEEYFKMQRERGLNTEAKEEFKYESKKFLSALPKRVRKDYTSSGENGMVKKPMEEKTMKNKSESADVKVLEYCLRNPAKWIVLTALKSHDQFKSLSRTTLSSAISRMRRFLVEKEFAISQGDQKNGYTLFCKITVREEDFDDTLLSLYKDYRQWINKQLLAKKVNIIKADRKDSSVITSRSLVDGEEVPGLVHEDTTTELEAISDGITTLLRDFLSNLVSQTDGRIDVNVSFDWTPKKRGN